MVVACGVDKQKLLIRKRGARAVRYRRLLGYRRAKLTNFAPNSGTIAEKWRTDLKFNPEGDEST